MITIATFNSPHRLAPHRAAMQQIADAGADIICAQEHADVDDWTPRGWRRFRPKAAQSTTIYWNPATVTAHKRGHAVMSSPGFHEHRGLTWVHFTTPDGPLRVASAHPPAFKTSRPSHAREYRRQMTRMAAWLHKGRNRVIAGDINGVVPSGWTRPLAAAGRWSKPVPSGPHSAKIDYVGVNKRGPWRIHQTRLMPRSSSDHHAVLVQLVHA